MRSQAVIVGSAPAEQLSVVEAALAARGMDVSREGDADEGDADAALVVAFGAAAVAQVRARRRSAWILGVAADDGTRIACLDAGADDVGAPHDVPARLDVLRRRMATEDRALAAALATFPDLIVRYARDGRFLAASKGAAYVPMVLTEENVGKNIRELFPAAVAEETLARIEETARTKACKSFEQRVVVAGAVHWYDCRYFPGTADDVVILIREITERKRVEELLRASETQARAIFDSKMLGMMEWSSDGGILNANDALLEMIGYTHDDLRAGRISWSKMTPPEYWAREEYAGGEIMTKGVCTPFEKEYVRKDGTRVPILIGGVALDELRSHGISFVIDISDRKGVERALLDSKERYELVASIVSDAVYDLDVLANRISWNRTLHTLFGYAPSEIPDTLEWWAEHVHPSDRDAVTRTFDEALAGAGSTWAGEYRFRTASGGYAYVTDRCHIIRDGDGRATRAVGAMVDVTERRELQDRLALADRLASLGTLAAGVAHELNNPLAHVLGNLDVAARALDTDPRLAIDSLADARRGAERMRSIVRDLRTFGRADVARSDVIDLRETLAWATRIAGHALASKARLVVDHGADDLRIIGDESRLSQVFVNLLVNAAQAIPEGDFARHEVRVTARRAGDRVVVSVSDTGAGIAADVLPRIFDPFFTTKGIGEGTGLGLSICHGIVSSFGGKIEVTSEVGRGATFRIDLPALTDPIAPTATPSAPTFRAVAAQRRGRILVVDDDALTRTLFERVLHAEHDVTCVGGATEALSLVKSGARFDVLFSDLMMPEMTGMDFRQELLQLVPEQAERLVFVTAGAFTPQAQRFLDEVPNACFEKPFDLEALLTFTRTRVAGS